MDNQIEERKEKVRAWLKDNYNLVLIGILILAFIVRVYFFVQTKGQTLWWDEAEYMSTAKHWAFSIPYRLSVHRMPLFQSLATLAFMAGLGENFIKFSFVVLPSLALVFSVYLLGKEMFNKKVGLIAALFMAVNWSIIFWTVRFQPDFLTMTFQIFAILFMWKYWKSNNTKSFFIILSGIFCGLALTAKVSAMLVPIIFALFVLIKDRLEAFKNIDYYKFVLAFLITLIPFFIWSYITFGSPIAFQTDYVQAVADPLPVGWYVFNFLSQLTENILFILFIVGLALSSKFILYSDVLIKNKKRILNPNIFSVFALFIITAFYVFYMKGAEDRWLFLWLPFIFFLSGNAIVFVYNHLKKYNKLFAVIIIGILLFYPVYSHLNHTKAIIDNKKESYLQVKQAGLWIKQNSEQGDIVFSRSYPQTVYYSERDVRDFYYMEKQEFDEFVKLYRPKFIIISAFERHPDYIHEWINENQDKLMPVQAYFTDATKQQTMLIVYEFRY